MKSMKLLWKGFWYIWVGIAWLTFKGYMDIIGPIFLIFTGNEILERYTKERNKGL